MDGNDNQNPQPKVRTFLGKAYLQILERNLYGIFRDVLVEEDDPKTGKPVREKLKSLGPLKLLREAEKGEEQRVVLRSHHPVENREISLVELE